ncbi:MAG TPA: ribonuclease P protein component [Candidatus Acetothermia bacterium]|nr:ribonuclease P protein component [Candidatus Acetothermia bacterium]
MSPTLGREHRLRRRREIARVFQLGQRLEAPLFSFRVLHKEEPTPRFLVVAGRRLGGAVTRNRVKRAVREGFRLHKELFAHLDAVIIPRPAATLLRPGELKERFIEEFREVSHGQGDAPHQRGIRAKES